MIKLTYEHMTGILDVDENHRNLVKLLNEATESFIIGINIDEFQIDKLYNYMILCFDCEEKWMLDTAYPEISTHIAEHELFTIRFFEVRNQYEQNANHSVELLLFYNNYINHHVRETNRKLGSFVAAMHRTHEKHGNHRQEVPSLTAEGQVALFPIEP